MPRPTILPVLNWKEIFASGRSFAEWIEVGESEENRREILAQIESQLLETEEEDFLRNLTRSVNVVAIAEDWCGDVVRHVPVLEKLTRFAGNLETRYLPRDQYPDVFIRFLTNGGESIPKFVFLNDRFIECGNWGPMPEVCRHLVARGKGCGDISGARKKVSRLYAADPQKREVVRELLDLVATAVATGP